MNETPYALIATSGTKSPTICTVPHKWMRSIDQESFLRVANKHRKLLAATVGIAVFVLLIIVICAAVLSSGDSDPCLASSTKCKVLLKDGSKSLEVAYEEGWIVIQRRGQYGNPEDYFYRNWSSYQSGFGDLSGEVWLGLDSLHSLTSSGEWKLCVELEDWDLKNYTAHYGSFKVEGPPMYTLRVNGFKTTGKSTAGDSLIVKHRNDWMHSGMAFSTRDNEQDKYGDYRHCAEKYTGAWWYNRCHASNLNGWNFPKKTFEWSGMTWYYGGSRGDTKATWRGSVMKIRKI